jgi:ATP-binding cassette subfamily B protein
MVDIGINNQDIGFVYLILLAQLFLFLSRVSVDFIRGWILLHIGARINISLVSDFLSRFMELPLSFFDTKLRGDYLQRISDQKRIENFLASGSIGVLFSLVNVFVFAIILGVYNLGILLVFIAGSLLYVSWISLFLKRRRTLDFQLFEGWARNQNILVEIFEGMEDVKLNNSEKHKRWEWEGIQANLFRLKMKNLKLEQYQQAGAVFINEGNNILITFMAASSVIYGHMTLGMMLAVSYILGQLNSPLNQLIVFMQLAQDAKISLERINDIEETSTENEIAGDSNIEIPVSGEIEINNLAFQYEGPHSPLVLAGINLTIPDKKVTAIVGMSGSGKTTLIKLLLGFYSPVNGDVKVGGIHLGHIHPKVWRRKCGAVMQDGYIFSDSLARNISMGEDEIDMKKLSKVARISQLSEFIEGLPMGYNTKIGANGQGLSQGQKQRILIARALYKEPSFLFFDEATNALDAKNEKLILGNLEQYFSGKTVVVVAHRLSTVRNAHKIVVLEKGRICETGTHDELILQKGIYFQLIKDQLELGM